MQCSSDTSRSSESMLNEITRGQSERVWFCSPTDHLFLLWKLVARDAEGTMVDFVM